MAMGATAHQLMRGLALAVRIFIPLWEMWPGLSAGYRRPEREMPTSRRSVTQKASPNAMRDGSGMPAS